MVWGRRLACGNRRFINCLSTSMSRLPPSRLPVLPPHWCKLFPILLIGCLGASETEECVGKVHKNYEGKGYDTRSAKGLFCNWTLSALSDGCEKSGLGADTFSTFLWDAQGIWRLGSADPPLVSRRVCPSCFESLPMLLIGNLLIDLPQLWMFPTEVKSPALTSCTKIAKSKSTLKVRYECSVLSIMYYYTLYYVLCPYALLLAQSVLAIMWLHHSTSIYTIPFYTSFIA